MRYRLTRSIPPRTPRQMMPLAMSSASAWNTTGCTGSEVKSSQNAWAFCVSSDPSRVLTRYLRHQPVTTL